jgi:hypothetical protein
MNTEREYQIEERAGIYQFDANIPPVEARQRAEREYAEAHTSGETKEVQGSLL